MLFLVLTILLFVFIESTRADFRVNLHLTSTVCPPIGVWLVAGNPVSSPITLGCYQTIGPPVCGLFRQCLSYNGMCVCVPCMVHVWVELTSTVSNSGLFSCTLV